MIEKLYNLEHAKTERRKLIFPIHTGISAASNQQRTTNNNTNYLTQMDKSVLQKATLDNDEPCAAWMFKAIANMTKASPKASDDVVQWLVHRLNSSKSPRTKKKCLNIIRSVATSGDPEFARQIIRQSEEIKKNASMCGHKICFCNVYVCARNRHSLL